MKLLLDENLPKRLKQDFSSHEVFTVREMGWNGISNGLLLYRMLANGFDALLTFDKNLEHQQNFEKYSISVIVLSAASNTYLEISKLTPKVLELLQTELPTGISIIAL